MSDVYCPGRSWIETSDPVTDSLAPMVVLENPCRHCPGMQTMVGVDCVAASEA